jgi:DNA-binding MarR family transcriptional regulator
VKEEDTDWLIYHLIGQEPSMTVEVLISASGLDSCTVEASLERLERYLLVERTGRKVRVLGLSKALLQCQIKYSDDLPYTIENGVIKERKK